MYDLVVAMKEFVHGWSMQILIRVQSPAQSSPVQETSIAPSNLIIKVIFSLYII